LRREWSDRCRSPSPAAELADHQSDQQRQRRDRLEIEQRLDADAADLLEVAHRADSVHDRAEDDRRDHHLDERNEAVTERLERDAGIGKEMADDNADGDGDQDLNVENGVPRAPHCRHRQKPAAPFKPSP
jgi:hypothetical protein